jgi:hypothetical protein
MFVDNLAEIIPEPVITYEGVPEQPYIISLDGEIIYRFNSEESVLEIASVNHPEQILGIIALPLKEGHTFIAFSDYQSHGFLIYETGKVSEGLRVAREIRYTDQNLQVIDLEQKKVKAVHCSEPLFKFVRIEHAYHYDPFKFLVKLSTKEQDSLEKSTKWAIYDFRTCEKGHESIILSGTADQDGALYLDVDEKPGYILVQRFFSFVGEPSRYEQKVFKISEEDGILTVQSSPLYALTEPEPILNIHAIAFNGDLYGSQREIVSVESGDASWRPIVIRRLELAYAEPERLEFLGPCEYYSMIQDPNRVLAFVEENISPEGVFNPRFRVAAHCEQDPLCREVALLFNALKDIQAGFSEDSSPRAREISDLKLNLGDEPFSYYAGDVREVSPQAKLLVFSRKKSDSVRVEGSIHSITAQSDHPVVRFAC